MQLFQRQASLALQWERQFTAELNPLSMRRVTVAEPAFRHEPVILHGSFAGFHSGNGTCQTPNFECSIASGNVAAQLSRRNQFNSFNELRWLHRAMQLFDQSQCFATFKWDISLGAIRPERLTNNEGGVNVAGTFSGQRGENECKSITAYRRWARTLGYLIVEACAQLVAVRYINLTCHGGGLSTVMEKMDWLTWMVINPGVADATC